MTESLPAQEFIDDSDLEKRCLWMHRACQGTPKAALGESLGAGLRENGYAGTGSAGATARRFLFPIPARRQRWWSGIEPQYLKAEPSPPPAVYFVSSNSHSVVNLLGGYAKLHRQQLIQFAKQRNPEHLADSLSDALRSGNKAKVDNLLYYLPFLFA